MTVSQIAAQVTHACEFSALQELVSHSMDRPERQQLKEALEAMQVDTEPTPTAKHIVLNGIPRTAPLDVEANDLNTLYYIAL